MTNFLRTINHDRWLNSVDPDWVPDGELCADVLKDLHTDDGKLSIWDINDEAYRQELLIALAAARPSLKKMDYIIFDGTELEEIGVSLEHSTGRTPITKINSLLHYDVRFLTANRLALLAELVFTKQIEIKRVPKKDVRSLLSQAADEGIIDKNSLTEKLRSQI